jgi:hypothetical protein
LWDHSLDKINRDGLQLSARKIAPPYYRLKTGIVSEGIPLRIVKNEIKKWSVKTFGASVLALSL